MVAFNKKKQKVMRKELRKEKQTNPKILSGIDEEIKGQSISNSNIKLGFESDCKQVKLSDFPVRSLNYDNKSPIKNSAKD